MQENSTEVMSKHPLTCTVGWYDVWCPPIGWPWPRPRPSVTLDCGLRTLIFHLLSPYGTGQTILYFHPVVSSTGDHKNSVFITKYNTAKLIMIHLSVSSLECVVYFVSNLASLSMFVHCCMAVDNVGCFSALREMSKYSQKIHEKYDREDLQHQLSLT